MKKLRLVFLIILIIITTVLIKHNKSNVKNNNVSGKVYQYMLDTKNRQNAYYTGVKLNNGSSANTCVYFVSEVLRKNGLNVDKGVNNTSDILSYLKKIGWKKEYDYKKLTPGDLCFTTDAKGNKDGIPTHTYIFMNWVKENDYSEAYICDNQAKDYNNKIYHIRNIKDTGSVNGMEKDAFAFFMK